MQFLKASVFPLLKGRTLRQTSTTLKRSIFPLTTPPGTCTIFDEKQTALCGIEEAYNQGDIDWKKPVSCHLYPVRVKDYSEFSAVNYHKWQICDDACALGKELQIPIYKFVKEALIRKFGDQWYTALEKIARDRSVQ